MSVRKAILSGAVNLGAGQAVVQLCSFVRSVILARLISPENFGIAATFAMTFSLLEMISNLSAQSLLVQAPDGDDPRFQATGHTLLVLRGILNAATLLLLAWPLSLLFGVPQARWAFYWLAVIPLARGFVHLDPNRFQRDMRFTPQVAVDTMSSLLVTVLAWPLAAWFRDYAAMLWLLLVQVVLSTIGSHIAAERRYTWAWDREYAGRFFSFGWPLLVNGLLMYGIFQGDRFLIASSRRVFPNSTYTLTDLGIYSVAFAVTMAPSQFFVNASSSLFLPVLARAQVAKEHFARRYLACAHLLSFSALVIAIPFIVAGRWIVPLVYGPKYLAAAPVVGWLGAMWGVRVFRAAPTLAAMSLGDTRNAMISNVVRTTALIGVIAVAAAGGSLASIGMCGCFGEVLATAVCIGRLSVKHRLSPSLVSRPLAVCGIGMAFAAFARTGAVSIIAGIGIALVLLCVCAAAMLFLSPELRHNVRTVLRPSEAATAAQEAAN